MPSLAHDNQHKSPHENPHQSSHESSGELAQARFDQALTRLEAALKTKMAKPAVTSSDDSKMIAVLSEEVEELRQYNAALNDANKTALSKVEMTIGRLKGMIE